MKFDRRPGISAGQTPVKVISSNFNTGYHKNMPSYTEMEINVILMIFSSLDAPEVVTTTTSSAGNEEKFVKMTCLFQCIPPGAIYRGANCEDFKQQRTVSVAYEILCRESSASGGHIC